MIKIIEFQSSRSGERRFKIQSVAAQVSADVERRFKFGGKELQAAEINWPGCGNRDIDFTREFTNVMRVATVVAAVINDNSNAFLTHVLHQVWKQTGLDADVEAM